MNNKIKVHIQHMEVNMISANPHEFFEEKELDLGNDSEEEGKEEERGGGGGGVRITTIENIYGVIGRIKDFLNGREGGSPHCEHEAIIRGALICIEHIEDPEDCLCLIKAILSGNFEEVYTRFKEGKIKDSVAIKLATKWYACDHKSTGKETV